MRIFASKLLPKYIDTSWSIAKQDENLKGHPQWSIIFHNGSKFVAISLGGDISKSDNGKDWDKYSSQTGFTIQGGWVSVAYNGSIYVVLANTGYISTSTDGISWNRATKITNLDDRYSWRSIIYDYARARFMAISSSGRTSTSTDGTTWTTAVQNTNLGNNDWTTLIYLGNRTKAFSRTGYISEYTSNGWTVATQNTNLGNNDWRYAGYSYTNVGGQLLALSSSGYTSTSTDDGETWTVAEFNDNLGNNKWRSFANNGSILVAIGEDGYISRKIKGQ